MTIVAIPIRFLGTLYVSIFELPVLPNPMIELVIVRWWRLELSIASLANVGVVLGIVARYVCFQLF